MIIRRVAITLATVAAAACLTAGSAAATPMGHHGGFAGKNSSSGGFVYENIGGPWGITRAHGGFHESGAFIGDSDN